MNNMTVAFPAVNRDQTPSTLLLPGGAPDYAESVAKRLALYLEQPVALSWNVPGDDLHLWVEQELKAELRKLRPRS